MTSGRLRPQYFASSLTLLLFCLGLAPRYVDHEAKERKLLQTQANFVSGRTKVLGDDFARPSKQEAYESWNACLPRPTKRTYKPMHHGNILASMVADDLSIVMDDD